MQISYNGRRTEAAAEASYGGLYSVVVYLTSSNQGRRSHRSWGVMTPTFRGKGGRGHNLGIIHMHCHLFLIKHTAHYKHTMSIWLLKSFHAINVSNVFILKH